VSDQVLIPTRPSGTIAVHETIELAIISRYGSKSGRPAGTFLARKLGTCRASFVRKVWFNPPPLDCHAQGDQSDDSRRRLSDGDGLYLRLRQRRHAGRSFDYTFRGKRNTLSLGT
jgi:hypothetical protein